MCKALNSFSSFGRKKILSLMRKNGCHLHFLMDSNSQLAYKPRSAITMTTQSSGITPSKQENKSNQGFFQDPFSIAGSTCQAIGMAQPRYTTLITKTTRTCPRLVASIAKAKRFSLIVHQDKTH